MHRNYFTLYHAATELHEQLTGGLLLEISSQHKNELTLSFLTIGGRHLQIVIVTHTPFLCLYTRDGLPRKERHSASLMREVHMQQVTNLEISPYDREILISLANGALIVLRLFNANTNVFLVKENSLVDAFKHQQALVGQPYLIRHDAPGILRELETLAQHKALFLERFNSTSTLPGFNRSLVQEILKRVPQEFTSQEIFSAFQSIFYELLSPNVQVTEQETGEPTFTLLANPLHAALSFDSVLTGLAYYSRHMQRFLETKEELRMLRAKLLKQLEKKQHALATFNPALLEAFAQNYEQCGHLLMAALYQPRTERQSITVENIFLPGTPKKTIPLKEALTLQKNAEDYFSKASKTRGKLKTMQERQTLLQSEKKALEDLLAATETMTNPKEARRFMTNHTCQLEKSGLLPSPSKKGAAALPFRSVKLSPSVTLLIGKNAANNDLLTFTHARPNDIWLHTRGAAGSHCVLKGATLDQLSEIRKAAEIAAWYSTAKHAELVPVLYTLKKYVRHGKHLAPGQVIVEREKELLVTPRQPHAQ